MTGEITLTAACSKSAVSKKRAWLPIRPGATTVIIPRDNLRDVEEFDAEVREHIRFVGVTHYTEVFDIAFRKDDAAIC